MSFKPCVYNEAALYFVKAKAVCREGGGSHGVDVVWCLRAQCADRPFVQRHFSLFRLCCSASIGQRAIEAKTRGVLSHGHRQSLEGAKLSHFVDVCATPQRTTWNVHAVLAAAGGRPHRVLDSCICKPRRRANKVISYGDEKLAMVLCDLRVCNFDDDVRISLGGILEVRQVMCADDVVGKHGFWATVPYKRQLHVHALNHSVRQKLSQLSIPHDADPSLAPTITRTLRSRHDSELCVVHCVDNKALICSVFCTHGVATLTRYTLTTCVHHERRRDFQAVRLCSGQGGRGRHTLCTGRQHFPHGARCGKRQGDARAAYGRRRRYIVRTLSRQELRPKRLFWARMVCLR
eukprot:m.211928 g.211928  ORF g.211928 m.211928 type:complete len:348 (-) comp18582_c0_seq2:1427-2470(-)